LFLVLLLPPHLVLPRTATSSPHRFVVVLSPCHCFVVLLFHRCFVIALMLHYNSSFFCRSSLLLCYFAISLLLHCPTLLPRLARLRYLLTPPFVVLLLVASLHCYLYWLVLLSSLLFCKEELGEASSLTTTKEG
jgi:hypothetical protein